VHVGGLVGACMGWVDRWVGPAPCLHPLLLLVLALLLQLLLLLPPSQPLAPHATP
jgi:hypothetical protein